MEKNCRVVAGKNLHSETSVLNNLANDEVFRMMEAAGIHKNLFFLRA